MSELSTVRGAALERTPKRIGEEIRSLTYQAKCMTVYFGVVAAYAVVPLANRLDKPTAKHSANTAHNSVRKMLFLLVFTT